MLELLSAGGVEEIALGLILVALATGVVLFVLWLARSFVLWYFRLDDLLQRLEEIRDRLPPPAPKA